MKYIKLYSTELNSFMKNKIFEDKKSKFKVGDKVKVIPDKLTTAFSFKENEKNGIFEVRKVYNSVPRLQQYLIVDISTNLTKYVYPYEIRLATDYEIDAMKYNL